MKIRHGFVSNSSTSSFLIYGIHLDNDKTIELTKKIVAVDIESAKRMGIYGVINYFEKLFRDSSVDMEIHCPYDCSFGLYMGRSWANVKDDETGKGFKERTQADILKALDDQCSDITFGTHEAAWQDG